MDELLESIRKIVSASPERIKAITQIREVLHELSPCKAQPVDYVRWVPIEMVTHNDYNPNSVALIEMRLLHTSISHDGYTQPCVVIWNPARLLYEMVDGFHRYYTMKSNKDIWDLTGGLLPVVVLNKEINDRMASTVRHNRARGKHSVSGMSNMVFEMCAGGWSDEEICNELGMSPQEILRLKHLTGFSKLFENIEYQKSWMTERQILIQKRWRESQEKEKLALASAPSDPDTPELATQSFES